MKFSPLKASVIALALFAVTTPGRAAATGDSGNMVVAQAADTNPQVDKIKKFLEGGRNLAKLDDNKLQQRLQRAQHFQGIANLPADVAAQLADEINALNAELARRQQAGSSGSGASGAAASTNQTTTTPAAGQTQNQTQTGTQMSAAPASGANSAEIDSFLASVQPVGGLNDNLLRQQMRKAAQLMKAGNAAQKKQLRQLVLDSRAELEKRKGGGSTQGGATSTTTGGATPAPSTAASKPVSAGQPPADVAAFLQSVQPAGGLTDPVLKQQMRQAVALMKTTGITPDQRTQLRQVIRDGRAELDKRKGGGTAGQTTTGTGTTGSGSSTQNQTGQPNSKFDSTKVDPASEQKARVLLDAKVDPAKLSKADLRTRLTDMRDLLQSNQVSPETKKALREKLAAERGVLRGEVGTGTGGNQGAGSTNNVTINNTTTINNTNVKVVLADRRPPAGLKDMELQQRIDVYRDAVNDKRYADADRRQWRIMLDDDRKALRQRMLQQRRVREAQLHKGGIDLNFNLGLNFEPNRRLPPRSVFAAEIDDSELADVLSAPPRRQIDRRYTVEEVQSNPQLRDAVARIEIDTVHFGFGEGFLREEEIGKLDRIAGIMEKILAKSPGEVFMIEGHTDAVGSEDANLQLSRERAQAVKDALTTYYVIPEQNLKPVGYGEKYLKIPTADPEPENRRVSIARITPLVGAIN